MRTIAAGLAVAAALAGCGDDEKARRHLERDKQVLDEIGPQADERLTRISRIAELLDGLPRAEGGGPFRFEEPRPVVNPYDKRNLFVLHGSDLKEWTYQQARPKVGGYMPWLALKQELAKLRSLLSGGATSLPTNMLKQYWDEFRRAEYILVLRGDFTAAVIDEKSSSYLPGRFSGDAQVFRLAEPKHLSGFPVEVRNSERIQIAYERYKKWAAAHAKLEQDLSDQLIRFLRQELVRRGGSPNQPGLGGPW